MSFATTHDRRSVTIYRDNMTSSVPATVATFRRYHAASQQGKEMTVEGISAEWHREGEGAWFPYNLRVFGAVIKKDGTPGQVAGQRDYIDYGQAQGPAPEGWLHAEIALYAPSGEAW